MSLSQALQHLLKANLVTLHDPASNPNVSSPKYNPNAKCTYHSNSPGHDTEQCWALKNNIQDLINNKTIEFDPPVTLNVITAPMQNHGKGVNAIEDTAFVSFVEDLTTPLTIVKEKFLRVGVLPGCLKDCNCCAKQVNGCKWLKEGVQRMINSHEVMFERTLSIKSLTDKAEDISIITISNKPLRISSKGPIRISNKPTMIRWEN